jgi:hypothetical protein
MASLIWPLDRGHHPFHTPPAFSRTNIPRCRSSRCGTYNWSSVHILHQALSLRYFVYTIHTRLPRRLVNTLSQFCTANDNINHTQIDVFIKGSKCKRDNSEQSIRLVIRSMNAKNIPKFQFSYMKHSNRHGIISSSV